MPCYNAMSGIDTEPALIDMLHEYTDMLCHIMEELSKKTEIYNELPQKYRDWHKEHQKWDETRMHREALRIAAEKGYEK